MYGTQTTQLYIDEFPLAEVKPLEGNSIELSPEQNERILRFEEEMSFSLEMRNCDFKKIFKMCFGREPYCNPGRCRKCSLVEDCIKAKISWNFNKRY